MPEEDPEEKWYSNYVIEVLDRVPEIADIIESNFRVIPGSTLAFDDSRVPTRPVSYYAHSQLTVAADCLLSLDRMIATRQGKSVQIHLSPFAHFALIRNALDCLAVALWLLEPERSDDRLKRLLLIERNEIERAFSNQEELGSQDAAAWKDAEMARIAEIAVEAGLRNWTPLHRAAKMPSTTAILKGIEPLHHGGVELTWLSMWQVASGHAHGKRWATMSTNELMERQQTRTKFGASYTVTASYKVLALLLKETVAMMELAKDRFIDLARTRNAS